MENKKEIPNPLMQQFDGMYANDAYKSDAQNPNHSVTLRDHFAGLAMQGHLASYYGAGVHCDNQNQEFLADRFYSMADAMLKQRLK